MLRIACRESKLAQIQSRIIGDQLRQFFGDYKLITCSTLGDRQQESALFQIGGKGLFVKEVELALLNDEADIAVHSLKDMPAVQPCQLPISAYSKRISAADVLLGAKSWSSLPLNCVVGTCSPRRQFQLKNLRPDLTIVPIRGNIETRIKKLEQGDVDAIVLAEAGLIRANINVPYYKFLIAEMLPAAGQGVLAIQSRPGFTWPAAANALFEGSNSVFALEREIVRYLSASCHSALAVFVEIKDQQFVVNIKAGSLNSRKECFLQIKANEYSAALSKTRQKLDASDVSSLLAN